VVSVPEAPCFSNSGAAARTASCQRGARAHATVRHAADVVGFVRAHGGFQLRQLLAGLLEKQVNQFAQLSALPSVKSFKRSISTGSTSTADAGAPALGEGAVGAAEVISSLLMEGGFINEQWLDVARRN